MNAGLRRLSKGVVQNRTITVEPNPMVQLLRDREPVIFRANGNRTMKQSLAYLATAAAIAVAVWAITGAPLPSHPDSRVAQAAGHH